MGYTCWTANILAFAYMGRPMVIWLPFVRDND